MSKLIVCACEDVTEADLQTAVRHGYRDIESVKRYTGFGTGFCQGKLCLTQIAQWLHSQAQVPAADLAPFTPRPPLQPTELGLYAALDPERSRGGLSPFESRADALAGFAPADPLPSKCAVAIIGGGILGLSLAYHLAKRGQRDVVVLEEAYLCGGASGRNGGGVRAQWNTATNIRLAKRSLALMEAFAGELGLNVWLRRGGYLFLAKSARLAERLQRAADLHQRHGLRTELRSADGAQELVPDLDLQGVTCAAWNPDDGVVFPWPFLWGYAQGARRLGARVDTFTRVTGIDVARGRVRAIHTSRGKLACDVAVIAAGAWSPSVAALAGVTLPNVPRRHEILSCEPLKPFLGPLVSVLDSGLYVSQSMRGELVGGLGDPDEPAGLNQRASLRFLSRFGQALIELMPRARAVKVVRQWAGCYDVTPDNSPILGETPGVAGLLQLSGFVGHGVMMAPAVGEAMGAWMTGGERDEIFDRFALSRFAEGRLEREDLIIG